MLSVLKPSKMLCTVASPLPPKLAAAVRDTGTGGGRIQPSRASERELGATFQARDACCRKSRCHDPDRRHCSRLQNSDPKPTRRVRKKKQPAAVYVSLRNSITCLHLFSSSRRLTAASYSLLHSNGRIFFTNKKPPRQRESLSPKQQLRLISSIQHHTTQQLSLISLKRFSISRRGGKKTENSTQRHTQAKARKLENFSSWHSKFTNANTLPEENNKKNKTQTKDQKQKARKKKKKKKKNLIRLTALRPLHYRAKIQKLRRW